jgi:hypothetical protein
MKLPNLQISELFLVKCGEDWTRTFMAEIIREKTEDRKDIIRGNVIINEGKIWCVAESGSEEELGNYLDEMCVMKLEYGLHSNAGVTVKVLGEDLFLN